MTNLFVNWQVNPDIFKIGEFAVRWYGLFFVFSFYFGYLIFHKIFKKEGLNIELLDKLTMYMLIATIVGARLGHCLFYQPDYYLKNPIEIFKVWHGGLASHGAAIGILFAIWLFVRKTKEVNYMWVVDRIVIVVALAGFFIRMGNLMNSEIVGKETDMKSGFVFPRNTDDQSYPVFYALWNHGNINIKWQKTSNLDMFYEVDKSYDSRKWEKVGELKLSESDRKQNNFSIIDKNILKTPLWYKLKVNGSDIGLGLKFIPRSPTQIYEAVSYLALFFLLIGLYYKKGKELKPGYLFGIFLVVLFSIRFLIEFLKEVQVDFEHKLSLNMGQLLSIPFILVGIALLIWINREQKSIE